MVSTGGIFTLITNDGAADRMLMATPLLHERLRRIHRQKNIVNKLADLFIDHINGPRYEDDDENVDNMNEDNENNY